MAGTLWYYTGDEDTAEAAGWVSKQDWDSDTSVTTRWLRSVYWSMTTLTTVGYGDISASTNPEMSYTVLAMGVGILFQAWLIGSVSKAINLSAQVDDKHDGIMAGIRDYMEKKNVSHELSQRVLTFQQRLYEHERYFDIHEFMRQLPPKLEYEMLHELYIEKLERCPCFKDFGERVLIELSQHIMPYSVRACAASPDYPHVGTANTHAPRRLT